MKKQHRGWTQSEIDALKSMRFDGITIPYCAKALGRSDCSVRNMCQRLKLPSVDRAAKDERIYVRVTEEQNDLIRLAANLDNRSLSSFIRKAALVKAAATLGETK